MSLETAAIETPVGIPEAPATEAPPPVAPQEDPKLSSKFAALARRERMLQKREAEAKRMYEDPDYKAWKTAKEGKYPLEAMKAAGYSYDEITQFVLNDGQMPPKTTDDAVKELQERLDAKEKAEQEAAKKAQDEYNEKVYAQHKLDIRQHVDASGDTYELIRAQGEYDTVFDVIYEYFEANGEVLSIDAAAEHVEKYLEEKGRKYLGTKKLGTQPAPQDSPAPAKTAGQFPATLTNAQTTNSPAPSKDENALLSDEESKRRAAEKLKQLWASKS
jgi:hypothetical protein